MFDQEYYESNNYTNYLYRQDRYIRLSEEVSDFLDKMNLLKEPVLDFGCAVGFLFKGLEKRVDECYGVDISEWALEQARKRGHDVSTQVNWNLDHGVVFGLDVFEARLADIPFLGIYHGLRIFMQFKRCVTENFCLIEELLHKSALHRGMVSPNGF